MKKIFKKNQIMITALAAMIAVAGYLNYSGKLFGNDSKETGNELAQQELLDISLEDNGDIASLDKEVDETPGEAVLTNGFVADAKITREQVRAQNKEILMEIINNKNVGEKEKEKAISEMVALTKVSEQEASVETMLLSKGFSEVVVTLTDKGADIVVNSAELTDAKRAQIEDIVTRKTGISPKNIVISPMHE